PPPSERPQTVINMITPGYFETISATLAEGRHFTDHDNAASQPVAIVNQKFARSISPSRSVVGLQVNVLDEWCEIVGVVADLRQFSLEAPAWPEAFLPVAQRPVSFMTFMVRTSSNPVVLGPSVRDAIGAVDPGQSLPSARLITDRLTDSLSRRRYSTLLLALFAGLGLLLAGVGVYGVIAYQVAGRTQEIGVRMALGAGRGRVLGLVLRHGLVLSLAGIALGIGGAIAATRFLTNMLYNVTPTDPITFAGAAAVLLVLSIVSCLAPARRAMRVDPIVALRYE
ncbi:MAG TPA: FtsX-like permease family protein, partial [Blastocatellia bacterium]